MCKDERYGWYACHCYHSNAVIRIPDKSLNYFCYINESVIYAVGKATLVNLIRTCMNPNCKLETLDFDLQYKTLVLASNMVRYLLCGQGVRKCSNFLTNS